MSLDIIAHYVNVNVDISLGLAHNCYPISIGMEFEPSPDKSSRFLVRFL